MAKLLNINTFLIEMEDSLYFCCLFESRRLPKNVIGCHIGHVNSHKATGQAERWLEVSHQLDDAKECQSLDHPL